MNKKEQEALEKDPIAFLENLELEHKTATEALKGTHASEIEALKTEHESATEALKGAHASEIEAKDAEIIALTEKLAVSLKSDNLGVVPGQYESENGKIYEFKKGFTKFSYKGDEYISEELIKEEKSEILEELIEMNFGGLIEVKKSK